MTREARLVFITTLTLLIYALSIFFDKGALLFPFPLNQAIILIVAGQISYWNFKLHKLASILMLAIGLFGILGNEFYWGTFLNYESMAWISEGIFTDIFQLSSGITTLVLAIYFGSRQKTVLNYLFTSLFCFAFISGLFVSSPLLSSALLFSSYLIIAISVSIKRVFVPIHVFWVLLLVLEASKLISIVTNK